MFRVCILTFISFLVIGSVHVQAQVSVTDFPRSFSSTEMLEEWAKTSTFGGGEVERLDNLFGVPLFVTSRMHTSGIVISDVAVYTALKTGEYVLRYSHPVLYGVITTEKTENSILFTHEGKVLKEFTSADVFGATLCQTSEECKEDSDFFNAGNEQQLPMCATCSEPLGDDILEWCKK